MKDENIEIYRQRYETFWHLDKLRWQMFQILAAIASSTALVLRLAPGAIEWWFYLLLSIALLIVGCVMDKIGSGIRANALELDKAAQALGDCGIPDVSNRWNSLAQWIAILVILLGVILFGVSMWIFVHI